jgi:PhnB protein
MQVQPYLFFDGRCEEALAFYQTAIGAEITAMMRFSENPDPQPNGCGDNPMAAVQRDKIMHASFKLGETEVMASDGMASGKPEFKGISLSLSPPGEAEGKRLFEALAEGGQVQAPLTKTFFSPCFGMVADRFGVSWMIVVPGDMPSQAGQPAQ